jgi:hypothetical protein
MKRILFSGIFIVASFLFFLACDSNIQNKKEASFSGVEEVDDQEVILVRDDNQSKVDVMINGELFTSYIYPKSIKKPVLFPLKTSEGTLVTRGFPISSRIGERVDHPHHVGLWFNYGDVNGLDFWNNSDAITSGKENYGTIIHRSINKSISGLDKGELEVESDWVNDAGEVLLKENTLFIFSGGKNTRYIDRITTLTAQNKDVLFKDNKEGMLGIRVARELEHPSDKPEIFVDASGKATEVPELNNDGVTGLYRSSEGRFGNDVWSTRAKWMNLTGKINNEHIAIAVFDHPDNVGYPTYWHARGYGLYSANPLGQKIFSNGFEELTFTLSVGVSVTFKHRIIIYSAKDEISDQQVDKDYMKFMEILSF